MSDASSSLTTNMTNKEKLLELDANELLKNAFKKLTPHGQKQKIVQILFFGEAAKQECEKMIRLLMASSEINTYDYDSVINSLEHYMAKCLSTAIVESATKVFSK